MGSVRSVAKLGRALFHAPGLFASISFQPSRRGCGNGETYPVLLNSPYRTLAVFGVELLHWVQPAVRLVLYQFQTSRLLRCGVSRNSHVATELGKLIHDTSPRTPKQQNNLVNLELCIILVSLLTRDGRGKSGSTRCLLCRSLFSAVFEII